ncbi:putative adenylate/guanylate cyclase [Flavobacteriales bacterium ALC-1]|nr:putative adenylate/guanylate cyclase [Flavobacteriales bacterium ALC-1]
MFTDIEDYTALMQQDEKEAIAIRERHRSTFEITTEAFNGKIIQYFGDGTLSIFTSSVEAVKCAIELQKAFLKTPKIPVRIGIHVGDIVYSHEDIIGDAVNVASRIESCAISGSVLISDKVHDQIRSHQDIEAQFLDAYELKNVEGAMPLFAIANDGLIIPKPEEVKGKLKDKSKEVGKTISKKKALFLGILTLIFLCSALLSYQYFAKKKALAKDLSIAVLPFDNLSTDNDAEIFRDGITEDILTQLSKLKELRVISRTSVMQYKDTKKTIPEIAEELGVSYILEGSIRKYGDDIRITAQLIDATTDEHLWAEDYDKTLINIFSLQTEVSEEIVDALQINLSFEEQQNLAMVSTKNIEAYKLVFEGKREVDTRTKESLANSILLYKEAIVLDPNYADAYAEIANSIYLQTYYSGRDHVEAAKTAHAYLDKAQKINPKTSRVYSVRGVINTIEEKHDLALMAFEKAVKLSPNDLTTRHQFATFYYYSKQYKKQLEQAEIAYRLDPLSFATANSYFNALIENGKINEGENLLHKIENKITGINPHVLNSSYFRLHMAQKNYKDAIGRLEKMVLEEKAFYRFLGFSYAKTGDTTSAYKTIETIRNVARDREKSFQLAMVYSGLQKRDSVLYYLDTIRNKQTKTFLREKDDFFGFLKDDDDFKTIIKSHELRIK